ncbi:MULTISPECIES: class I SAM-dependent methyltransferase [unclassified Streptomyces]|uniref:class I SAM-dependent methyltransferase n=1 Tax=unclassified Streptomyces TaxID=2593676 RepID=UPI002E2AF874|nr:class I SAM-dependent methyltransferase [Streptomyces sp. NBC_00228]WSW96353.1 methyltransferase domain-containing protein [Streptomyces sp. NBC_00989]
MTGNPQVDSSDDQYAAAQRWDEMYRGRDQIFSGNPNGVLVAETIDLPPGRALDVGCGEGADALWLARRGWQVTAVDISETALRHAAAAATDLKDRVTWTRADLTTTPPPAGAFDLVSLHYFPLMHRPHHATLCGLLDAVAPGGTLLFATHAPSGLTLRQDFDPADYYQPDDIAQLLDPTWNVLVNETRPRAAQAPVGTHHTHDTVLRALHLP